MTHHPLKRQGATKPGGLLRRCFGKEELPFPPASNQFMWKEIAATEFIWKETAATEPGRTTAQPVTEEELSAIFNRLDPARDILRQNRELREVSSRREGEAQALRTRNAELEEIVRQFAPTLPPGPD